MNFFTIKTSWSTMELGLIKIAVASGYIIIGTCFHEFLKDYLVPFGLVFIITAIWSGVLWFRKMKTVQ